MLTQILFEVRGVICLFRGYALNDISGLETNLVAGEESEVLGRGNFHEIFGFDPEFSGEGDLTCACVLVLGIVLDLVL